MVLRQRQLLAGRVDLGPAKVFTDAAPSTADATRAAGLDILLLVLYNALLFSLAYACFMRQDVTPGAAR